MIASPKRARRGLALALLATVAFASGCGTVHPPALSSTALAEAQTFPYYRLYWVGSSFTGHPLAAVDGLKNYSAGIGDSVYYGDCVNGKGLLGGGGSCLLPLQVTTVIYGLHSNAPLGPQRNILIRGVPATVYNEERSIELYSGRLTIDVFSDTLAHAQLAAGELLPVNAPGSASADLPPPVFCPGLSGPISPALNTVMNSLPGRPCQKAQAAILASERLASSPSTH
ncbi:MAG TPA: hypothetical protein VIJ39_08070 [Solirubrobacteraceae bacterium]